MSGSETVQRVERSSVTSGKSFTTLLEGRFYWAVTAVLFALCAAPVTLRYPINHDISSHLDLVSRVLDGERLYSQIYEPNPPLIFAVFSLPVLLERAFGVWSVELVEPYLVLLLAAFLALAAKVIARVELPRSVSHQRLLVWMLLLLAYVYPGLDFGQREHLMTFMVLPYLAAAAGYANGKALPPWLAILVGTCAAIGLALKPFFAGVWLLTEAFLLLKTRRSLFRAENVLITVFQVLYTAYVVFGTSYIANLEVIRFAYVTYENAFGSVLRETRVDLWLLALLAFLACTPFGDTAVPLRTVVALALIATLVSALVQMKGWSYHTLPVRTFSWLALALSLLVCIGEVERRFPGIVLVPFAALALVVVPVVSSARALESLELADASYVRVLSQAVSRVAGGRGVAWLSNDAYPAYPVTVYGRAHSVLRLGVWPLPSLYRNVASENGAFPYRQAAERSPLESLVIDQMVADLDRAKPALIVADRRPVRQAFGATTFDYIDFFSRDARFNAILARHYDAIVDLGPFRFFARKTGAAAVMEQ
jgi:hypothetical protein